MAAIATSLRNLAIALTLSGSILVAGRVASAQVAGLDITAETTTIALVIGAGTFAGLSARSRNRPQPIASAAARSAALAFPPRPGHGYLVVARRARAAAPAHFDLRCNDALVAQLAVGQFVVLAVAAGTCRLHADIPGAPGASAATPLAVDIPEQAVRFYETRTAMGLMRTSVHLEPVADTQAMRAALARMVMVVASAQ